MTHSHDHQRAPGFTIFTDHKNLKYLKKVMCLAWQQAQQTCSLSGLISCSHTSPAPRISKLSKLSVLRLSSFIKVITWEIDRETVITPMQESSLCISLEINICSIPCFMFWHTENLLPVERYWWSNISLTSTGFIYCTCRGLSTLHPPNY